MDLSQRQEPLAEFSRASSYVLIVVSILGLLAAGFLYSQAYELSPIWPDSGYTLPMSERILEGLLPFRDLGAQHTTSVMFFFAGVSRLWGAPLPYEGYLALNYAATFLVLLLLNHFLKASRTPTAVRCYVLVQTAVAFYAAEGWTINLEPFVLLTGLSGAALVLRDSPSFGRLLLGGLLVGVSITAKQYALFIYGALLLAFLCSKSPFGSRIKEVVIFTVGTAVSVLLYFGYLATLAPNGIQDVLWSATGRWYRPEPENFMLYVRQLLWYSPYLVLFPLLIYRQRRDLQFLRTPVLIFATSALFLSMGQGLIRQYPHYLLHTLPFAGILLAVLLQKETRTLLVLLVAVLSLCTAGFAANKQYEHYIARNMRAQQKALARQILKFVPERSKVMFMGSPSFQYLCNFLPANNFKPGYNFLHNYSGEEMKIMLKQADFLVTSPNDYMYFGALADRFGPNIEDFSNAVTEAGYQRLNGISDRNGNLVAEIFQRGSSAEGPRSQ